MLLNISERARDLWMLALFFVLSKCQGTIRNVNAQSECQSLIKNFKALAKTLKRQPKW